MKHCELLESGITFQLNCIQPCCPGLKYTPPSIPFNGGEFPHSEFLTLRNTVREQNQLSVGPCIGCPNLVDKPSIATSKQYKSVVLENFKQCNARCDYCGVWKPPNTEQNAQRYSLLETIPDMICRNLIHKDAVFTWGGGEPTILKEFEELSTIILNNGFSQLVNTNAMVFSSALLKGLETGKTSVQVSIDSGTKDTFSKVKGRDLFDVAVANIGKYAKVNRDKITMKYILKNNNNGQEDINGFLRICNDFGIRKIGISPDANESWGGTMSSDTISATIDLMNKTLFSSVSFSLFGDLYGDKYLPTINSETFCTRVINKAKKAINYNLYR